MMKTFTYTPTSEDNISSTDLLAEQSSGAFGDFYRITIYNEGGSQAPEYAEALYIPSEGRLGIAWGADATWADVKDVGGGIEMWLNDGETWEAAN